MRAISTYARHFNLPYWSQPNSKDKGDLKWRKLPSRMKGEGREEIGEDERGEERQELWW